AGSGALVPALVARGDLRLRRGAAAEGLADAERVIAAPDVPEALGSQATLVAALCEGAEGRHAEAAARLAALAAARPEAADADRVLLELGIAQARAGDAAAAERTLDGLRTRFPRSPRVAEAWLETGESRFAGADWQGAADAYRAVLGASKVDDAAAAAIREQALHKLAWTFAMRDDPAAAGAFAAQLEAHPQGACAADARVMLGDALFRSGRVDEALPVLEEALATAAAISSPDLEALAVVRAAGCEVHGGDGEGALGRLDAWWPRSGGAEVSPRSRALARFTRADALHRSGRLDESLAAFRSLADEAISGGEGAAAGAEAAARARLMEGEILFEQKRHADAVAAFFKVAYGFGDRAAPPSLHPWQAQATFEAARCCDVLGKPEQALSLYAELVERYPEAPFVAAARKRIDALGDRRR
ncbi:MAG: tetratricopeptide repeat protein, partial [Planctomycetaceae bacterium]